MYEYQLSETEPMPCLCICHIAWCLHWPKTSALEWGWHQEAAAPFHNIAAKLLNHISTFNILNFWIWIDVLTVCFVCSPNATIICYVFTQRQVSINSQLQVWVWVFAVLIFKTLCLFFETKIKATETTDMYMFLQMFFLGLSVSVHCYTTTLRGVKSDSFLLLW